MDVAVVQLFVVTPCGLLAARLDVAYRHELARSSVLSVAMCRVPRDGTSHESLRAGQARPRRHNYQTAPAPTSHFVYRSPAFSRTSSNARSREVLIPALSGGSVANALYQARFGPSVRAPLFFNRFSCVFYFLFLFYNIFWSSKNIPNFLKTRL